MKKYKLLISLLAIVLCISAFSTTAFAASVPVYKYADTNADSKIDIRDLVHAYVKENEGATPSAADWDFDKHSDYSNIRKAIMNNEKFGLSIDSDSFETIF